MFKICDDNTSSDLKDQLDQINDRLNHANIRRMIDVEFRLDGRVWFT